MEIMVMQPYTKRSEVDSVYFISDLVSHEGNMTDEHTEQQGDLSVLESRSWFEWLRWCPTSPSQLAAAETRVLQHVNLNVERFYIPISNNQRIWTLKVDPKMPKALPIVFLHGFGTSAAVFFLLNTAAIAEHRAFYAFDLLGFGQSSRPKFSTDPDAVEEEFVRSIDEWREGVGLEKFILLGNSFGGFLAAAYALKHPSRVKHLMLLEPWGFPDRTEKSVEERKAQMPFWWKVLSPLLLQFSIGMPLRAAGPFGPKLLRIAYPDVNATFGAAFNDNTVMDYFYHCNAQSPPSGEIAFTSLLIPDWWEWSKRPLLPRMTQLRRDVPITFIYGADSWMDSSSGTRTKSLRKSSYVDVTHIQEAGHAVYIDQAAKFNEKVVWVCENVDRAHQSKTTVSMETCI